MHIFFHKFTHFLVSIFQASKCVNEYTNASISTRTLVTQLNVEVWKHLSSGFWLIHHQDARRHCWRVLQHCTRWEFGGKAGEQKIQFVCQTFTQNFQMLQVVDSNLDFKIGKVIKDLKNKILKWKKMKWKCEGDKSTWTTCSTGRMSCWR